MEPDSERELRFQRWQAHIRKIGEADEKVLRYLWDLYDTLLEEINTNQKQKTLDNGKT